MGIAVAHIKYTNNSIVLPSKHLKHSNKTKANTLKVASKGIGKYVHPKDGNREVEIACNLIAKEEPWDGIRGYVTNSSQTASGVMASYKRLWTIEACFRLNKHDLKIHPIFHHKPDTRQKPQRPIRRAIASVNPSQTTLSRRRTQILPQAIQDLAITKVIDIHSAPRYKNPVIVVGCGASRMKTRITVVLFLAKSKVLGQFLLCLAITLGCVVISDG